MLPKAESNRLHEPFGILLVIYFCANAQTKTPRKKPITRLIAAIPVSILSSITPQFFQLEINLQVQFLQENQHLLRKAESRVSSPVHRCNKLQ